MSLTRLILFFILFYFLFKALKAFIRYVSKPQEKRQPDIRNNPDPTSKYKNIEEAKYTEIKSEPDKPEKEEMRK